MIVGRIGCRDFVVRGLRRRAEIVGEAGDAADLRADRLIGALVVERAVNDVALDLIVRNRIPLEIDMTFVRDAFKFCGEEEFALRLKSPRLKLLR